MQNKKYFITKIGIKNISIYLMGKLKQIPLISVLDAGRRFASKGYPNYHQSYFDKQQWKIIFYTLFNPRFASKWFTLLKSPNFSFVFIHRPRLYIKPFRPYISIKWNKKQKVKVILDTYRFIKSKGETFTQLLTHNEDKIIAHLVFNNTYEGFLKLGYDDRFRKEGELVLSLECSQLGGKIISVAFSFEEIKKGRWVCLIGCVQGQSINTQHSSKLAQKLMFGLRPNSFIIFSAQELSRQLGCTAIYGVGDSIQAYRKKHTIHLPWVHKIHFNYDKFWYEVGGQNIGEGWFELPLIPVLKNIQEIKSNKRSMYRNRYHMLDNLSLKISNSVKALLEIS